MGNWSIEFEQPMALLLALLIIPVCWSGWRCLTGMSIFRRLMICAFRALVILLVAATIAMPRWLKRSDALSVILLVDHSKSISNELEDAAIKYLQNASNDPRDRLPNDKLAVINIGGDARVDRMPDKSTLITPDGSSLVNRDATNLAQGIRLALALPRDSATRFVLASDGNENVSNVLSVADIARSNKIPIDVLVIKYDYSREVLFDRIIAPAVAREGQPIALRLALQAREATTGRISLYRNDQLIDISPDDPGTMSLPVKLDQGINLETINLILNQQGPQRFRAVFEPDNPADDPIPSNDQADAVVVVGGEGRVLVIDDNAEETATLRAALGQARIDVDHVTPTEVTSDLLTLSAYDSIILANVPAHAFGAGVDDALRRYVHDIGGGLIMLGGPESLGAGGWIDSEVSKTLPVRLDPPDKQQMPKGALICIMHASEIPQGNYWGQQCAIAAVQALSRLDMAGVLDFDWNVGFGPGGNGGSNWVFPLQTIGDKSSVINAIKKMNQGDLMDFSPLLQTALAALNNCNAGQKHVIIISDGDPQAPSQALLSQFIKSKISISTVIAGGHGNPADAQSMAYIAKTTGGTFYNPSKPGDMPRIFIKEAMVIRRSLIVEGETYSCKYIPSSRPGPFVGSWPALPSVKGYVLTAPRPGYDPSIVSNLGDPVFAYWQYGLGKSEVFTSDATSRWGQQWVDWGSFQAFWEKVVRWSMRPAAPTNVQQSVRLEGDRAVVEVQVLGSNKEFANFGKMVGLVISPDLKDQSIELQQVGPGKWRGEFDVNKPGSWVANLIYDQPDGNRYSIQAGVSVPYSPEYRTLADNPALLKSIADSTGGRVLPSDPAQANLFNRQGLDRPATMTDLWPLFAMICAGLFVLDVAARRIAFDPQALRRTWYAFFSGDRAGKAEERMGRLKQTKSVVQQRRTGAGGGAPTRQETEEDSGGAAHRLEPETASKKFIADAAGAPTSFDVSAAAGGDATAGGDAEGRLTTGKGGDPARGQPAPRGPKQAQDEQQGGYTSRLLEAKRRARANNPDSPPDQEGGARHD